MDSRIGQAASVTRTVTEADTAAAVGSGDLAVLATPIMLAWLEAATIAIIPGTAEQTSVGASVAVDHVRPSAVGAQVTAHAEIAEVDGRMVTFKVRAVQVVDGAEFVIGRGVITRAVVERAPFLAKVR